MVCFLERNLKKPKKDLGNQWSRFPEGVASSIFGQNRLHCNHQILLTSRCQRRHQLQINFNSHCFNISLQNRNCSSGVSFSNIRFLCFESFLDWFWHFFRFAKNSNIWKTRFSFLVLIFTFLFIFSASWHWSQGLAALECYKMRK